MKESAYEYVKKIKTGLQNKNRFIVDQQFNDLLDILIENEQCAIKEGDIFYRGRIYLENDARERYEGDKKIDGLFQGYDAKNSFVNIHGEHNPGRANPRGISYLYVSKDIDTCALEVCNKKGVPVSIAKIRTKIEINLVDLSKRLMVTAGKVDDKYDANWVSDFKREISNEMNFPFFYESEYILCQYFCEYIKSKEIDGVMYNSTVHKKGTNNEAKNIVIFNYDKCEAVSSELYYMNNIEADLIKRK